MSSDWEQLSEEQQQDVSAVRERINRHLMAEIEAFYQQHPELQLQWSFTCDVLMRGIRPGFIKEFPLASRFPRKPCGSDEPHALIRDARGGFTMIGSQTIKALEEEAQINE